MSTHSINTVVFDAVGTLIYPDPPVAAAYQQIARRFGSGRSLADIQQRFHQAFDRQEEIDSWRNKLWISEQRERNRWRAIVRSVFPEVANPTALYSALWRHFARPCHWRVFADVNPVVLEIESRQLTWCIASNFDARLEPICTSLSPLDRAHKCFISSSLRSRKPQLAFFRAAEQVLDSSRGQLLFIGDNCKNDYQGAVEAGWRAILLDRSGKQCDFQGDRIQSLQELFHTTSNIL